MTWLECVLACTECSKFHICKQLHGKQVNNGMVNNKLSTYKLQGWLLLPFKFFSPMQVGPVQARKIIWILSTISAWIASVDTVGYNWCSSY